MRIVHINESALRILRSSFASCITYTSKRRSTDLVYAMASEGTDLDPEVEIVARRAVAFRRYYTKNGTKTQSRQDLPGVCKS